VLEKPAFIQGVFAFDGAGLESPQSFKPPVTYQVPSGKRAQTIYFRAGNSSAEMIYLVLSRNGKPMRYFPIGAKGAIHVSLAVLEDIPGGSAVEILFGAPHGVASTVMVDIGFLEIA
jgi:hypothetical protein